MPITYNLDNPINPATYGNKSYTFMGRRLQSFTVSDSTYNYTYDEAGLRIGKTSTSGDVTKYLYNGTKLAAEIAPNYRLDFLYDEKGLLYGFVKDGTTKYFYVRDVLKNILGIIDSNGAFVVKYAYTGYGDVTVTQDTSGLATLNPFRWKGYYFDQESGMYYCHTRYYVPEWCRWLNADHPSFLQADSLQGLNLFTYCKNNPVSFTDHSGNFVSAIFGGLSALVSGLVLGQSAEQIAYNVAVAALTGFLVDVAVASVGAAVPIIIAAIGVINFAADAGSQMLFEDKKINEVDWVRAGVVGGIAMATSLIGVGIGKAIRIKGENVMSEVFNMLKDPASWGAGYVYSFGLGMAVNIFVGSGAISTRGNSAQSHKTDENLNCYSY